jgi:S-DNA-T family DNA segregation ATPase FtsK/SpoIIIE
MAKRPQKKTLIKVPDSRLRGDITGIILTALGVFLIFALYADMGGKFGDLLSYVFFGTFGPVSFSAPVIFIADGVLIFMLKHDILKPKNTILFSAILFVLMIFISGFYMASEGSPAQDAGFIQVFEAGAALKGGGFIGMYTAWGLHALIGTPGLFIVTVAGLIILLIVLLGKPLSPLVALGISKAKERREIRAEERDYIEEDIPFTKSNRNEPEPFIIGERPGLTGYDQDPQIDFGQTEKQQKILENVKSAEEHITGAGTTSYEPAIEIPGNTGLEPKNTTGLGIEPKRPQTPGTGLGADYNNEFTTPVIASEAKQSTAATSGEEEEPLTLTDLDFDSTDKGTVLLSGEATDERTVPLSGISTSETPRTPKSSAAITPHKSGTKFETDKAEALARYKLPTIDLLSVGRKQQQSESAEELKSRAHKLEQTLKDFRVDAKVVKVTVGPSVTRYEVEPDTGVKIHSIRTLEPDLALKLEVKSVRVVAMPGKALVGIEAYNNTTTLVTLREMVDSPEFRGSDSKISFVLGKDISGKRIIVNLSEMPHLLIAGTTGSGKSVCINSILLSILYHARPDEVKFIMVDPKVVELKSYSDIPHLLVPVVTEPERAATALGYAVSIMEERYRQFAEHGVRNLEGYNAMLERTDRASETLPQIVIVIDELSDLMLIAPAKVQEYINRLAAKARAAGMHLIVATQQPLASILTSVIKANIPSRIAFSVASNSESRVILDEPGAERLHGNGDMLFKSVKMREPMRIQGSFVSDSEVHKVTQYIKKQMDPDYSPDITDMVESTFTGSLTEEEDDLFIPAVEMAAQTKLASVSNLQRRFRIGYNRAARLVDMMEERGIVGPSDGSNKPRKLIMTQAQLAELLGDSAVMYTDEDPPEEEDPDQMEMDND